MKKHLHNSLRVLLLSLTMLLSLPLLAEEIDGINYALDTETKQATVIAKSGGSYSGEIIIPRSVGHEGSSYSVTSIGGYAFHWCYDLTKVTIPNSVESIGTWAFAGCYNLRSVNIPNSVTSIGSIAFSGCSALTSITIPNSVTSIGGSAFENCSGLTSVTIPNSVERIESATFMYCSGLTSVTIPNSVTSIGDCAFGGCSGLTSVTIPNSVTSIGNEAFEDCSGLTSATIPNSVESIGGGAFKQCSGLTLITIPNSVTSIGDYAFTDCTALTSVTIPNSVQNIGEWAFEGCSVLTSVTIGNSVESIGGYAFAHCYALFDVYCYAEKIPSTYSNAFKMTNIGGATLHVPAGSIDCYKTTSPWSSFGNIVALSNQHELSVSSAGYATLCLGFNAEIPQDVEVYVAEKADGDCLKMKKVEGVLPANTGVIVKANEGTYAFIQSEDTSAEIGENLLVGSVVNTMVRADENTSYYILAAPDDNNNEVGMYRVELIDDMFECKANKAYLPFDSSAPARIRFDFGTETGILETENGNVKTENCYDLSGRKVENAKKGIFIVNGKKVVK